MNNQTVITISFKDGEFVVLGEDDSETIIGSEVRDGLLLVGVIDPSEEEDPRLVTFAYNLDEIIMWTCDEPYTGKGKG